MISVLPLVVSLFAGACAGALFFEGLWRTVARAAGHSRPICVFVLSFGIRAPLMLAVLWVVSRGNPFRVAACVLGFLVIRPVILRIHCGGKNLAD